MPTRILLVAAALCLGLGAWGLASNGRTAEQMRARILADDQAGRNTVSQIIALREYSSGHMHAGTSFELTGAYQRAVDAAHAADAVKSSQVYTQAEAACSAVKANAVAAAKCIGDYVASHSQPGQNPQPPQLPQHSDYQYKILSPRWTPDPAGLALLTGGLLLILAGWVKLV